MTCFCKILFFNVAYTLECKYNIQIDQWSNVMCLKLPPSAVLEYFHFQLKLKICYNSLSAPSEQKPNHSHLLEKGRNVTES